MYSRVLTMYTRILTMDTYLLSPLCGADFATPCLGMCLIGELVILRNRRLSQGFIPARLSRTDEACSNDSRYIFPISLVEFFAP